MGYLELFEKEANEFLDSLTGEKFNELWDKYNLDELCYNKKTGKSHDGGSSRRKLIQAIV